jgi:multiple sugar transport system permease protein
MFELDPLARVAWAKLCPYQARIRILPMATTANPGADGIVIGKPSKWRPLESEGNLAALLLLPTMALLLAFIAYPFMKGILLAVTDTRVGLPGKFIGMDNFYKLFKDPIFHAVIYNTFLYTFVTTIFKLILGLWLAILLNRDFKFKRFTRAFILLPFIVPTVLACFAWKWMFDPTFSVLNWILFKLGVIAASSGVQWLADGDLAMVSIMIVNIWRGVPFFAISLMAGLQTISPDLGEAAAIDGAKPFQRFWYITWPLLLPVTMVVVLFSVIQTFADFQIVYVMTGGGPANATHLFATYAYQLGIGTGLLSEGAAVSLAMFPLLFLIVIFQLLYIRKVETR